MAADEDTVYPRTARYPASKPAHPGETLREDVLPALGMPRAAFARHLKISRNTLYKLLNEQQPVTLDIALRLGKALGNGPRFWLALQMQHDAWLAERTEGAGHSNASHIIRCRLIEGRDGFSGPLY